MSYRGGVYSHVYGGLAGGHAVKLIGWGVENGQEYWLCANSWGPSWGERGFFKMSVNDTDSDMSVGYGCKVEEKGNGNEFLAY